MIPKSLKIDMTPMVDLGFLLISFFVITTQLSQPKAMDLYVHTEGPPTPVGDSYVLTVLLDTDNTIYYYHGDWEKAFLAGAIIKTNYSGKTGLRTVIEEKQKALDLNTKNKEGRNGLMLLIKPARGSTYKNFVDVLDETVICIVKKYAIVPISADEMTWLEKKAVISGNK